MIHWQYLQHNFHRNAGYHKETIAILGGIRRKYSKLKFRAINSYNKCNSDLIRNDYLSSFRHKAGVYTSIASWFCLKWRQAHYMPWSSNFLKGNAFLLSPWPSRRHCCSKYFELTSSTLRVISLNYDLSNFCSSFLFAFASAVFPYAISLILESLPFRLNSLKK